ncbi:MAG: hypothetical protein AAB496_01580 [Patescibacteria group bacterium]
MKFEPIEVRDFISQLVSQIEDGVNIELRHIVNNIDIEVVVERVVTKGGGLKIYVASGKAEGQSSHIAKARFSVRPRQSEREKNIIAETRRRNEEQNEKWRDW